MSFTLNKSFEILERTPDVLNTMLLNISEEWTTRNEGGETWSVYDVIGHLVHGEKKDWVERTEIILSDDPGKVFEPFDRFAQFRDSKGKSLEQLLDEFKRLREINIRHMRDKNLNEKNLVQTGIHPVFGQVSLRQMLSTWVAHDLNHLAQICRVMARQYEEEVGPWAEYLRILNRS